MDIIRYSFGKPVRLEAVVEDIESSDYKKNSYFSYRDGRIEIDLKEEDIVYGLGPSLNGMNKRKNKYISFAMDDNLHTPDKKNLYAAHNFLLVYGQESFAIFIDNYSLIEYDIDFTIDNKVIIELEDPNFDLYLIKGGSGQDIVRRFRKLIGQSYIPAKWAFGYGQSRWGYKSQEEIREVVDLFNENDIPLDMVYLDLDYMEDFKDFTINRKDFKDFEKLTGDLKDQGVRLIPIIDAGVKIEEGYDVYEEGLAKSYFAVDSNKDAFIGAVWPGFVHFPDFFQKEARDWFGDKYSRLIDMGIEGFWNDMNEPAIFYSPENVEKIMDQELGKDRQVDLAKTLSLMERSGEIKNSLDDYRNMYHKLGDRYVSDYDLHNAYGYMMTRSAAESIQRNYPDQRHMLFSRASTIGMHRYSGIWTGDNHSWWSHLLLNIEQMPNLNMTGFLFSGADTGGFNDDVSSELMIRWNQFSIYTPLYRNHSAVFTRRQEPFAFNDKTTKRLEKIIKFRYMLLPYIYSEFNKAALNNDMYFSPMSFVYQDQISRECEDQLFVGDKLMIAPVYEKRARGRFVYLAEDMVQVRLKSYDDITMAGLKKGVHYVEMGLDENVFFLRKNAVLPLVKPARRVSELDYRQMKVLVYLDSETSYSLYDDDGIEAENTGSNNRGVDIRIGEELDIDIDSRREELKRIDFLIYRDGRLIEKQENI